MLKRFWLFGLPYFEGSVKEAADWLLAQGRGSRYVCVANVHTAMNSLWVRDLRRANEGAALLVPDGRPLSLLALLKGHPAKQIRGAALMRELMARPQCRHYLFGGAPGVAEAASRRLKDLEPRAKIVGWESPPFRALEPKERKALQNRLRRLNVDCLWVALGAPKQEIWMSTMQGKIPCNMIGVGAAFDYYAGSLPEAPAWMQNLALEWLYRLVAEPRRLWRRYLLTNSLFLLLAPLDLFGFWRQGITTSPVRIKKGN